MMQRLGKTRVERNPVQELLFALSSIWERVVDWDVGLRPTGALTR